MFTTDGTYSCPRRSTDDVPIIDWELTNGANLGTRRPDAPPWGPHRRPRRVGAYWEQQGAPNGSEPHPTALTCSLPPRRDLRFLETCRSRPRRYFVDTEEVTGSNPVSPTKVSAGHGLVTDVEVTAHFPIAAYIGSKMGAEII